MIQLIKSYTSFDLYEATSQTLYFLMYSVAATSEQKFQKSQPLTSGGIWEFLIETQTCTYITFCNLGAFGRPENHFCDSNWM